MQLAQSMYKDKRSTVREGGSLVWEIGVHQGFILSLLFFHGFLHRLSMGAAAVSRMTSCGMYSTNCLRSAMLHAADMGHDGGQIKLPLV